MKLFKMFFFVLLVSLLAETVNAQSGLSLTGNVDFVSRYVWRGMDFGGAPSAQPSIGLGYGEFSLGAWGAYSLSNNSTASDEIDLWISYAHEFNNSMALTLLVTDYTFPNNGIKFFNFNNYDNPEGAGAHTLEAGASLYLGEAIPITISGFYNFYNDAGSNSYIQLDYQTIVKDANVNLFCGATPGSKDNPSYYGTENFNVINIGAKVTKSIKISNEFALPLFVSYILNPQSEKSFLVLGISL